MASLAKMAKRAAKREKELNMAVISNGTVQMVNEDEYYDNRHNQWLREWQMTVAAVNKFHNPMNFASMLPVVFEWTDHNGERGAKKVSLTFKVHKAPKEKIARFGDNDFLITIEHGEKSFTLGLPFHEKADLNWEDKPQGCTWEEKVLTSLVLHASEGGLACFQLWNAVVKRYADKMNMMPVYRVLD